MKRTCSIQSYIFAVLAVILLTSCGSAERDLKNAEQANSEEAFKEFIRKHPNSPLVAKAKTWIENDAYDKAKKASTAVAFRALLKRFPNADMSEKARNDLAKIEFGRLSSESSIKGWEEFIHEFPRSENVARAKENLIQLQYDSTIKLNDIDSYEAFLKANPDVSYAADIRKRLNAQLEERDWNQTLLNNTLSSYLQFATNHPKTERVVRARGAMSGRAIMMGDGGLLLLPGMGNTEPDFELTCETDPAFAVKVKMSEAFQANLVPSTREKNGLISRTMSLTSVYKYPDAEAVMIAKGTVDKKAYVLVSFKAGPISVVESSDNTIKSSEARRVSVSLLSEPSK